MKKTNEADKFMRYVIVWLVGIILLGILILIIRECANVYNQIDPYTINSTFMLMHILGIYFVFLIFVLIMDAVIPPSKEEQKLYDKYKSIEKKYKSYEVQKLKKKEARYEWKLNKVRMELMEFKK